MAQRIKTDWILFGAIVFLVAFGLLMLFSASSVMAYQRFGSGTYYLLRQLGWALASVLAMTYLQRKDYRSLNRSTWVFGLISVVLVMVIAVHFLDAQAQRRMRIGSIS